MSTDIATTSPALPVPGRLGQATAVEQTRAAAEVAAAVHVAQQCPRNVQSARAAMLDSCDRKYLAEKAFYRFPRAGGVVSGASVHLARELARCWGNVQYGISELRRDDDFGQSEMQAWAWDVQTNTRASTTFIVPHARDKKDPKTRENLREPLPELRDIYENNANNGARRVREMIFSVLPPWFAEEAQETCRATLEKGDGKPLAVRVSDAIDAFARLDITPDQMEQKLGRPRSAWTEYDVAQLQVMYRSLRRGEISREDEFPPPRVTAAEITAAAPNAAPQARPAEVSPPPVAEGETGDGWPEAVKPGTGGRRRQGGER